MQKISLVHPTIGLVNLLELLIQEGEINKRDKILTDIMDCKSELEKIPIGAYRYLQVRNSIEIIQKHTDKKILSCKKGCSACCHIPVHLTKSEATVIKNLGKELNVDKERAKKQANIKGIDNFMKLSLEDRKCVFLHNNVCSIYELRPIYCMTFKVISDPKYCNTEHQHLVKSITNEKEEVMHNALINCEGEIDVGKTRTIADVVLDD